MKTLMEMSLQEIYDTAKAGLEKQGWERSINKKGGCLYRGPNGTKCAFGHLIPDDVYTKALEDVPVYELLKRKNLTKMFAFLGGLDYSTDEKKVHFLDKMQQIHDMSTDPQYMKSDFLVLGKKYELNIGDGEQDV